MRRGVLALLTTTAAVAAARALDRLLPQSIDGDARYLCLAFVVGIVMTGIIAICHPASETDRRRARIACGARLSAIGLRLRPVTLARRHREVPGNSVLFERIGWADAYRRPRQAA